MSAYVQVCVYGRGSRQDLWGDLQVVQSSWSTQSLKLLQQPMPGVPATPAYLALTHRKVPSGKIGAKYMDS